MPLSRRTVLESVAALGIGAAAGSLFHGYEYARLALEVLEPELPVPGLPPAFHGLRVGFITDLHHSAFLPQSEVARAAALVMERRPDLIALGGDYVTNADRRFMEPCAEALGGLHAPLGVFAILGNHDDERVMPAALARRGFAVLKDARTAVTKGGDRLELAGIRFWTRRPGPIARVLQGAAGTTLLLAHDPRRLTQAAELAVPAVLSGHTHGGQIVLPGLGAVAARKFPVVAGHGRREGTHIYVSRGVGTVVVPFRINCPPEVAIVTLRPSPA